jgi:heme A synthase
VRFFEITFFVIPLIVIGGIVAGIVWAVNRRRAGPSPAVRATAPRDLFLYLLATVALYISAIGAMMVIAGLADYWFPEPFDRGELQSGSLRFGLSMLIVAFPIFLYLNRVIHSKIRSGEVESGSTMRAGFTYFTLFVIAVTALVDLMIVVNVYLNGELTPRFAIKAGGVLAMVGLVYLYYRNDLKVAPRESPGPPLGPEVTV